MFTYFNSSLQNNKMKIIIIYCKNGAYNIFILYKTISNDPFYSANGAMIVH